MSELTMSGVAGSESSVSSSDSASPPREIFWSLSQRAGFRFFFSYFVLFGFPFPLDRFPGVDDIVDALYYQPWQGVAAWVGERLLGHSLSTMQNGESDRSVDFVQNLLVLIVAIMVTAIWSVIDRRRAEYGRLLAVLRVYVRYMLVFPLFLYAAIKIVKIQCPDPEPDVLMQMYGDSAPAKLFWTFMGHSYAYSAFVGGAELVAGLLLCFRRTTTLGAVIASATLLNVVLLNICFNVGVKLWSTNLLVMAVFLASLDGRRLAALFVLDRSTEPAPPITLPSVPILDRRWRKNGKLALKVLLLGLAALAAVKPVLKYRKPPPPALFGIYDVASFERNGEAQPLVITDPKCWRGVIVDTYGRLTIRFMDETSVRYRTKADASIHTLALNAWDEDKSSKPLFTLSYAQSDADHLTLEGAFAGERLQVRLRKVERKFRLREEKFRLFFDGPIESKR
jgi:hypothetical protein